MARIAQRRGARFKRKGDREIVFKDEASRAIYDDTVTEVAEWLGFASSADYDAATADERKDALERTT